MEDRKRSRVAGFLSGLWTAVDQSRRFVVNIFFLALVVWLVWMAIAGRPKVPREPPSSSGRRASSSSSSHAGRRRARSWKPSPASGGGRRS